MAALLKDKPKRGRPSHAVSRQNVYVELHPEQKQKMALLASLFSQGIARADIPDLAVSVLVARLEAMYRAVADRSRIIPEGITDMESLYLLWDLSLPNFTSKPKWTSIRLSPQQMLELGSANGRLNMAFGANRSETFSLGLALFEQYLEDYPMVTEASTMKDILFHIQRNFLQFVLK